MLPDSTKSIRMMARAEGGNDGSRSNDPCGPRFKSGHVVAPPSGRQSIFTLVMTVPQVWTIWIAHQASGVSVLSWSAYLLSAVLWFWFGVQRRDRNIYLPCVGWVVLDSAVIAGALLYG
jgi:uncharacterized protein with PQ loop repeat